MVIICIKLAELCNTCFICSVIQDILAPLQTVVRNALLTRIALLIRLVDTKNALIHVQARAVKMPSAAFVTILQYALAILDLGAIPPHFAPEFLTNLLHAPGILVYLPLVETMQNVRIKADVQFAHAFKDFLVVHLIADRSVPLAQNVPCPRPALNSDVQIHAVHVS